MDLTWHCDPLGIVNIDEFRDKILSIPFEEWPANPNLQHDGVVMINHMGWSGLQDHVNRFLSSIKYVIETNRMWHNPMLSVVMPEASIRSHRDKQGGNWEMRIHFPIKTNPKAFLIMDKAYNLEVGYAYKINTNQLHAIVNHGDAPRIHFMVDVLTL